MHGGCPAGEGKISSIGKEASVECQDCPANEYPNSNSTSVCQDTTADEYDWESRSEVHCASGYYTAPSGIEYDASGAYASGCEPCTAVANALSVNCTSASASNVIACADGLGKDTTGDVDICIQKGAGWILDQYVCEQ
jgi:hypothetical protein